ncbi:MAG: hypothetical protein LUQ38_06465 [Methanotrichaceae archaeon]|nr:hypothetical protein [Methanotrichaceae archaeon]
MKYYLELALIMLLSPAVNAVPYSLMSEPYNVSFDMGFKSIDYIVSADPTTEIRTLGGEKYTLNFITIRNISSLEFAPVMLTQYEREQADMGFKYSDYIVGANPPTETETLGGEKYTLNFVTIRNASSLEFASIMLTQYEREQAFPTPNTEAAIDAARDITGTMIETEARTINGVTGVAESYYKDGETVYYANYHPAFDPKRMNVSILSTFPWDDGTLSLLNTIQVQKLYAIPI